MPCPSLVNVGFNVDIALARRWWGNKHSVGCLRRRWWFSVVIGGFYLLTGHCCCRRNGAECDRSLIDNRLERWLITCRSYETEEWRYWTAISGQIKAIELIDQSTKTYGRAWIEEIVWSPSLLRLLSTFYSTSELFAGSQLEYLEANLSTWGDRQANRQTGGYPPHNYYIDTTRVSIMPMNVVS